VNIKNLRVQLGEVVVLFLPLKLLFSQVDEVETNKFFFLVEWRVKICNYDLFYVDELKRENPKGYLLSLE
jgi:hypothetical protein